ncbi:hypothetical protein ES703_96852 [subsurface metagenome]
MDGRGYASSSGLRSQPANTAVLFVDGGIIKGITPLGKKQIPGIISFSFEHILSGLLQITLDVVGGILHNRHHPGLVPLPFSQKSAREHTSAAIVFWAEAAPFVVS